MAPKVSESLHVVRANFEKWVQPLNDLPELMVIGRAWARSGSKLEQQSHTGLEICYIERGNERWRVGNEFHRLRGGDMIVLQPNEPHGPINKMIGPCTQYWVQIARPRHNGWLGLCKNDAMAICRGISKLPRRQFPVSKAISKIWETIFGALDRNDELATVTVRSKLTSLLLEAIVSSRKAAGERRSVPTVTQGIQIMEANLAQPLPIPIISAKVGCSTSQFKRQFRLATGIPPAEFYLRARVSAARQQIVSSNKPLASIALDYGFSSSQYLTTCLKRVLGCTPSALRRERSGAVRF